jgi:acyl carrier protein
MEIKQQLIAIFKREGKINIGEDNFSADVNDLGIDSLTRVRIVVAIEQEFDISIEEQEMLSLKSVKQLYDFLLNKLNRKQDGTER